jgi:hypothetical protein
MDNQIVEAALNIFQPVLESSMVLAAQYAKQSGRDVVTSEDTRYSMRYCARYVTGRNSGSLFPEIYEACEDEDEDEDEDDYIVPDDDVPPFTRYQGDDELMNKINECWDTWSDWEPQNEAEVMIKNAIDSYDGQ